MVRNGALGTNAVKLTISKFIALTISLVSSMLLSRFRSLEEYGTYSQLIILTNIATTIIMMGLPNSINYFLSKAETNEERDHFLSVYYTSSTLLSLIAGITLCACVRVWVNYFENPLIQTYLYFLAIYPWTKIICQSVENLLVVYGKSTLIMVYRISNSACLLAIILIVKIFDFNFDFYLLLFVCVESIFSLWVYILAKSVSRKLTVLIDWKLIKSILEFSLPIGIASMIGTINIELDKIVIGGFLNTEQMAIYTNASKEMPVTIIATSITAVLMPKMVQLIKKKEYKNAVDIWKTANTLSFEAICFLAFALICFAPEVIDLLYSSKYLPGVSVFRVYSLVLVFRSTYYGMMLNATGKTKYILYSSLFSLGLNVLLNYLFFLLFGMIGPAIATFLATGFIQIIQLIASSKVLKVKFSYIFPWKNMFLSILINLVLCVAFLKIKEYISLEIIVGNTIEAIILGIIWALVLLLIRKKVIIHNWSLLNEQS